MRTTPVVMAILCSLAAAQACRSQEPKSASVAVPSGVEHAGQPMPATSTLAVPVTEPSADAPGAQATTPASGTQVASDPAPERSELIEAATACVSSQAPKEVTVAGKLVA